ncbi:LOW QUALITY PROTEIN: uncharacterized protein LOC125252951 [Megalobrama amblycephala]|uniref:LOW QUALITY PROTEIN: uncharacterized protein LOC125252951 n=1 Tax=Megalobrama amblycephala TaxID=75352 RepID=UPI002013D468|nr:LOW QUALITY PROTEIN: uncharacterized protein LOC125252951 [Megalobrama amblycephala]
MFVLALLTSVVLRAFSAQAEMVDNFKGCERFFYKQTKPGGMDQNTKEICQKYKKEESITLHSYYATLYSPRHRIPLYSAYTFDPNSSSGDRRKDIWHVEPQISDYQIEHMVLEKDLRNLKLDKDRIKEFQAMTSDYLGTGYDRGHLNPSSFQSCDGRTATFTLTNAAPMDPCFNRIHWYKWENSLKKYLKGQLELDGSSATAYIVTGTVPDANKRIPEEETSDDPLRVTVPSHIWTAVCYKHHTDDTKSLSFSYMAKNQPEEFDINLMSVSNLNNELSRLYGTGRPVKIFVGNCFEDNYKLKKLREDIEKLMNPPGNQIVKMNPDMQNTFGAVKRAASWSGRQSSKNFRVSQMTVKLAFNNMSTYFSVAEDLKVLAGSACLITHAKPLKIAHDELRKREVSEGTDAVECLLVPENRMTAVDGSGGKTKLFCSTSCLYNDEVKGYRCESGKDQKPCSPQYSLITVNGEKCMDGHPCATYGYDYYWCWTSMSIEIFGPACQWDYCSPPLWGSKAKNGKYCRDNHACAKYGSSYTWCYTDDEGNWDYC